MLRLLCSGPGRNQAAGESAPLAFIPALHPGVFLALAREGGFVQEQCVSHFTGWGNGEEGAVPKA